MSHCRRNRNATVPRINLLRLSISVLLFSCLIDASLIQPECQDLSENCRVTIQADQCRISDYLQDICLRSCGVYMTLPTKYDVEQLPSQLRPIEWLVGIWRSESGGEVNFPTIPRSRFGEQMEISLTDLHTAIPSLSYITFAWGMNKGRSELHSESGFITMSENATIELTTIMSNGFATVEKGQLDNQRIYFQLADIGRISFTPDLSVTGVNFLEFELPLVLTRLIREWSLLDPSTLQNRLQMSTLTKRMEEHTTIVYKKIFP